jgi:hypothetical protein
VTKFFQIHFHKFHIVSPLPVFLYIFRQLRSRLLTPPLPQVEWMESQDLSLLPEMDKNRQGLKEIK